MPRFTPNFITKTSQNLQRQLAQGSLTTRQVATVFIERVHALDQAGPSIHSVIELNHDAWAIASKIDGDSTHDPLHGIPIGEGQYRHWRSHDDKRRFASFDRTCPAGRRGCR